MAYEHSKLKKTKKKAKKVKAPDKNREEIDFKKYDKMIEKPILAETGTRFNSNSARQLAFDHVVKFIEDGKRLNEMRELMTLVRKDNGYKYNLDAGYVRFAIGCHPEFFKVYNDDTVELVRTPKPDYESIRKTKRYTIKAKHHASMSRQKRREMAVKLSTG